MIYIIFKAPEFTLAVFNEFIGLLNMLQQIIEASPLTINNLNNVFQFGKGIFILLRQRKLCLLVYIFIIFKHALIGFCYLTGLKVAKKRNKQTFSVLF